jgi:lysozyme family protein
MNARFKAAYDIVMKYEGGYVNHPNDPGGETYKGISRVAHPDWEGWEYIDQKKSVPEQVVMDFYYRRFWVPLRCDEMPTPVGEYLFDFAVNVGHKRAIMSVQKALKVVVDGILGPVTMGAIKKADPVMLMYKLLAERIDYYTTITLRNRRQFEVFYLGWIRRTIEVFSYLINSV